jgi:DNA-binding HxlR family transcriptional regulator
MHISMHEKGMPQNLEEASVLCPFGKSLYFFGKPHTLQILYGLSLKSPLRFTQIQKGLDVAPKELTLRLRELVRLGLVNRRSFDEIPPRVEYRLTQKGRDLQPTFDEMHTWYNKYNGIGPLGKE